MYHILSCRKFSRQTLRIVDTGETSIEAVMGAPMGECLICGPCSHVEVGQNSDYWTNHGGYETLEDATIAAWFHEQQIELHRIQDARVEFSYHVSLVFWIAKADRMKRDFFVAHRECMPGTCMRAIHDALGILVTNPHHVIDIAMNFYAKLLWRSRF